MAAKNLLEKEQVLNKVAIKEATGEILQDLFKKNIRSLPVFFDGVSYTNDLKAFISKIKEG